MKAVFRSLLALSSVSMPALALAQAAPPSAADAAPPVTDANAADAAAAVPAAAASGQLGDIVVTAQRRSESLQRVPLAVTALDTRALQTRGITNLNNLASSVTPGVVVTQFAGTPSTLAFNVRGAYTADPGVGLAEQGVAIYVDGVPIGRAVGTGIELGDIERIELLRGPQGTLFGRNAEGGAVQFVTKRPTGVLGGRVEVGHGNYDAYHVLANLDLPEFAGISIKLSGLWDKHDGYTNNVPARSGVDFFTPGFRLPDAAFRQERSGSFEDLGFKEQRGFRAAVQWKPFDGFTANYTYDFSDLNYTVAYNSRQGGRVPSSYAWCLNPAYAATCASGASIAANIYYGTPSSQPITPKFVDVPTVTPQSSNHIRGHGLTLEYVASDQITFKSITGLRYLRENGFTNLGSAQIFVQTIPTSAFADSIGQIAGFTGSVNPAKIKQSQFSEELQMLGTFGDLKLTAGGFYYREHVNDTRSSFFAIGYQVQSATTLGLIALTPFDFGGVGPDGLPASLQRFDAIAHSYAAYAQATYTPSNFLDGKLSLTGGLRYTKDKKTFDRVRAAVGALGSNNSVFNEDRFDPAATIAYQATPSVNIYARYARAYRAGGTGIRNKLALTTYAPEINTTYEAGIKSQLFDNHVRFNVAAFHSIIKDSQVSFQNSAVDPSSTDVVNASGNIKIDGVEVESNFQITPEFAANVGYSYMHGDVKGVVVSGLSSNGIGAPPVLVTQSLDHASYLPKHQINVGLDYTRPIQDASFFAHLEYSYSSHNYNDPRNLTFADQGVRTLSQFNGRIGLRDIPVSFTKIGIELYGYNLLNKHDHSYAFGISSTDFTVGLRDDAGGSTYGLPPRTFGILARASF